MSNPKRNVGDLGEDTLALWASQLGVVSNRVQRDRTGWDNFLEFPAGPSSSRGGALDTAHGPIKCLVQVKSSDQRATGCRVSLANLERLVRSPLPTFFLVLEFDGYNDPQRASLIHVDRRLAYWALEKLRHLSVAPRARRRVTGLETVRITAHDRLAHADAACFGSAVRNHLGADLNAYVALKQEWVRSVGYENGRQQVNLTFRLPQDGRSASEVLVDFALGIEPELEILSGDVRDLRFGVPAPVPLESFPAGHKFQVERKPIAVGQLTIRSKRGEQAILSGEVFGPVGFGALLEYDNIKVRFESQFVDASFVLGKAGDSDLTLRLPGSGVNCQIDELGNFSNAILMASRALVPEDIEFELSFADQSWAKGTLRGQVHFDEDAMDRASAGSHAWTVARAFDLSRSTLVQVDQLLSQKKELELAHAMLAENPDVTSIEVTFDEIPPTPREVCVPIAFTVQLGESICIVAGAILGIPVPIQGVARFTLARRRWRHHVRTVVTAGARAPQNRVQILEDIAKVLADDAEVQRWWDGPASKGGHPPAAEAV